MPLPSTHFNFKFITSIAQIPQTTWDKIAATHSPFLRYHFLYALENSGSVNQDSGWQPNHLAIYQDDKLVGALPAYTKTHSYGEYVFDYSWANAYYQHGLNYYPKLVVCLPFTPVTCSKLLVANEHEIEILLPLACAALQQRAKEQAISSIHWLFTDPNLNQLLCVSNQVSRQSVQFHWHNKEYKTFDDFLACFNSRKRKNVKKERNKIHSSNLQVRRLTGTELDQHALDIFYLCYQHTYLKRSGHTGYLNRAFFEQIFQTMSEQLMLVVASYDGREIASALFFFDEKQLCGRYWGCLQEFDGLHFECCYYQGIEFCIERNIALFNPGTQGEHKIARGFEPTYCYSNHWMADQRFHQAIARFCQDESRHIQQYHAETTALLPFKHQ